MKNLLIFSFTFFFALSLKCQSLVGVDVDDLSDGEIISLYNQGKAQGYTLQKGEEIALSLGLSQDDALKFKTRVESLIGYEKEEDVQFNYIPEESKKDPLLTINKQVQKKILLNDSNEIFGQKYFLSDIDFNKSYEAKAPRDYVLGSGDELTLSVFGISYFQKTFKVNESGIINIGPKFGKLNIRGMTFENVEKLIKARISRGFDLSKNVFDLNLSYGRQISINIIGEVRAPGTYSLRALNNAFHALVAAGGPTQLGSLRNVRIFRDGDVIETIDFYKFFTNPEGFKIPYLTDGDFLSVSPYSNVVNISGAFKRVMNYEILPGETLESLFIFSSGFSSNAYDEKVKVFRNGDKERIIIDVSSKDYSSFVLNNDDSVHANFKKLEIEKYVNISGALAQPGIFGFEEGMTLGKLIRSAGGLSGLFLNNEIILSRLGKYGKYKISRIPLDDESMDFELKAFDFVQISSRDQIMDEKNITLKGSVHNPGDYKFSFGMTLDDAIKASGGLKPEGDYTRIEVARRIVSENSSGSLEVTSTFKSLAVDSLMIDNWDEKYEKSSFILKPFDIITVRKIKNYGKTRKVYFSGAIEFPGSYELVDGKERISDLIYRAGGLDQNADPFNSILFNEENTKTVLNLESIVQNNKSKFNYILKNNDSLFIPEKSEFITIKGNGHGVYLFNQDSLIKVPFMKGSSAKNYIKDFALGFDKAADKRNLSVSYPNGKFDRTKNILFWKLYPKPRIGGTINIDKKVDKKKIKKEKKPLDWNQFVATITSAAMGFGTVYALINRP